MSAPAPKGANVQFRREWNKEEYAEKAKKKEEDERERRKENEERIKQGMQVYASITLHVLSYFRKETTQSSQGRCRKAYTTYEAARGLFRTREESK